MSWKSLFKQKYFRSFPFLKMKSSLQEINWWKMSSQQLVHLSMMVAFPCFQCHFVSGLATDVSKQGDMSNLLWKGLIKTWNHATGLAWTRCTELAARPIGLVSLVNTQTGSVHERWPGLNQEVPVPSPGKASGRASGYNDLCQIFYSQGQASMIGSC